MSPITITQITALPLSLPQSILSIPRGISVHPTKISSSLHRRHSFRSFATQYPLTVQRSPVVAGRQSAALAGAVSCLLGSSAKTSTGSEDFLKKTVSSGDIVVFSKSYCPASSADPLVAEIRRLGRVHSVLLTDRYCARVKSIFKDMNKDFSVIELDERDDGQDIQDALGNLVGRRTVPQVFIKGNHIGGCDDTVEAYGSGRLVKLLAEVQ